MSEFESWMTLINTYFLVLWSSECDFCPRAVRRYHWLHPEELHLRTHHLDAETNNGRVFEREQNSHHCRLGQHPRNLPVLWIEVVRRLVGGCEWHSPLVLRNPSRKVGHIPLQQHTRNDARRRMCGSLRKLHQITRLVPGYRWSGAGHHPAHWSAFRLSNCETNQEESRILKRKVFPECIIC